MAELVEPLRPPRVLHGARWEPLKSFSCGPNDHDWEQAVNDWAQRVYHGTLGEAQAVVVLEDAAGKLVGLSAFKPKAIRLPLHREAREYPYIHMLGTDRQYQGKRLEDGSRPGDALLVGAVKLMEDAMGTLRPALAFVHPDNDRSHRLFDRHDFGRIQGEIDSATGKRGDDIRTLWRWHE